MIDAHRDEIEISVRGTCLKMTCRKSKAPWGITLFAATRRHGHTNGLFDAGLASVVMLSALAPQP